MSEPQEGTPDVPTIGRRELKERLDRDEDLVLLEALPEEDFEEYHLPGARNLPLDEVRERAGEIIPDRDAQVVVYCANEDCPASPRATRVLLDMGYRNVRDYEGGKEEWRDAGHPVEEGSPVSGAAG